MKAFMVAEHWPSCGGGTILHLPELWTTDGFAVLSRRVSGWWNSLLLNQHWLGAGFQADFQPSVGANLTCAWKEQRPDTSICLSQGRKGCGEGGG